MTVRISDKLTHIDDDRSIGGEIDAFPSDATAVSAITSCSGISGFDDDNDNEDAEEVDDDDDDDGSNYNFDNDSAAAVATTISGFTALTNTDSVATTAAVATALDDADSTAAVASAVTDLSIFDTATAADVSDTIDDLVDDSAMDLSEDAMFALTPESSAVDFLQIQQQQPSTLNFDNRSAAATTAAAVENQQQRHQQQQQDVALLRTASAVSAASSNYDFPATSRLPTFDAQEAETAAAELEKVLSKLDVAAEDEFAADAESFDDDSVDSSGESLDADANVASELDESPVVATTAAVARSDSGGKKQKVTIPVRETKKSASMKNLKDALLAERAAAIAAKAPTAAAATAAKKKKKTKKTTATTAATTAVIEEKPSPYEKAREEIIRNLTPASSLLIRSLDEREFCDLSPDDKSPSNLLLIPAGAESYFEDDEEELIERVARESMEAAAAAAHAEKVTHVQQQQQQKQVDALNGVAATREEAAVRAAATARQIEIIVAAARAEAEKAAAEGNLNFDPPVTTFHTAVVPEVATATADDYNDDDEAAAEALQQQQRRLSAASQDVSEVGMEGPFSVHARNEKSLRRFESMLVNGVHSMCKKLLDNHARLAPIRNAKQAFQVWKRCTKWLRKIDDHIPLSVRKLAVVHPELLWRIFCLYVPNKNLIPYSKPTQVMKTCCISPSSAARLSSGFTPSPRGSRANSRTTSPAVSRIGSFNFNGSFYGNSNGIINGNNSGSKSSAAQKQLNFEGLEEEGDFQEDTADDADVVAVAYDDGEEELPAAITATAAPEEQLAQQAASHFTSQRRQQQQLQQQQQQQQRDVSMESDNMLLQPHGVLRHSFATSTATATAASVADDQSRFKKKLLDLDGLWSLLKDFNVCPHLFGKAKLKEIFDEMIKSHNSSGSNFATSPDATTTAATAVAATTVAVALPAAAPRRSYVSPDGRIHFKLTAFNASTATAANVRDGRSRSRSPAAAAVRQRQLSYGRDTAQRMAAHRSSSADRYSNRNRNDSLPQQQQQQRAGDDNSCCDGSEAETLSTVFSIRSRSTSPLLQQQRSRSPSILGGRNNYSNNYNSSNNNGNNKRRGSHNPSLCLLEQHLAEAACVSPRHQSYEFSNPLISFNIFVKMLWRMIASFMTIKLDDPRMDSVREFLTLMSKYKSRAINREIEKILPVLTHDRDRRVTAFK